MFKLAFEIDILCLPFYHEESLLTCAWASEAGARLMLKRPNHQLLSRPLIGHWPLILASDWPRLGPGNHQLLPAEARAIDPQC